MFRLNLSINKIKDLDGYTQQNKIKLSVWVKYVGELPLKQVEAY